MKKKLMQIIFAFGLILTGIVEINNSSHSLQNISSSSDNMIKLSIKRTVENNLNDNHVIWQVFEKIGDSYLSVKKGYLKSSQNYIDNNPWESNLFNIEVPKDSYIVFESNDWPEYTDNYGPTNSALYNQYVDNGFKLQSVNADFLIHSVYEAGTNFRNNCFGFGQEENDTYYTYFKSEDCVKSFIKTTNDGHISSGSKYIDFYGHNYFGSVINELQYVTI